RHVAGTLPPRLSVALSGAAGPPARLAGARRPAVLPRAAAARADMVLAPIPDLPDLAAAQRDRTRGRAHGTVTGDGRHPLRCRPHTRGRRRARAGGREPTCGSTGVPFVQLTPLVPCA